MIDFAILWTDREAVPKKMTLLLTQKSDVNFYMISQEKFRSMRFKSVMFTLLRRLMHCARSFQALLQ